MGYDGFQGILVLMEMKVWCEKVSFMVDLQEFQYCFNSHGGKDLISREGGIDVEQREESKEERKRERESREMGGIKRKREGRERRKKEKNKKKKKEGPPMNKKNKSFTICEQCASKFKIALFTHAKYFGI